MSRDEFVVRAQAARTAGYDVMEALNAGHLTEAAHLLAARAQAARFAAGGRVGANDNVGRRMVSPPVILSPTVPSTWDGGAGGAVGRLVGQVERLTAEVMQLRRERREDAKQLRRLTVEIATDQIDVGERQEQQLRSIAGSRRRAVI